MTQPTDAAARFLQLHRPGQPLLLPNPWDIGSARVLASLGFEALATTSSGFAATLGLLDGSVTRDQAIGNAAQIVGATPLPVSADLENGYADDPQGVAATVAAAIEAGLAGCSIEDFTGRADEPFYEAGLAAERVAAAAEAAHAGPRRLVLTARAENHLRGRDDLADTIARLQSYVEAGADVVYAPGLTRASDIRDLVSSVDRPVNVLAMPGAPTVAELADLGVARISVGGAFAYAAIGALAEAARELRDAGTYGYQRYSAIGREITRAAFPA
jgi:2-methylisocitrate lyase-like PEP mutase family enzyme